MTKPIDQQSPLSWEVSTTAGPAGPFHQTAPPDDTGPLIWVRRLPAPALVLGSTQPDELIRRDRAAADGVEVCRRRSGGGLVFIDPATDCWIDLVVPRSSHLWHDDVGRAFHWVGDHWASVLDGLLNDGTDRPVVHRTSDRRLAGKVWCFADLGHGEVTVAGSKVVGLSQRRTRSWLRIQGLMLGSWPGPRLRSYVDLDRLAALHPDDHELLDPALVEAGFPTGTQPPDPVAVADRFVADLPSP